MNKSFVISFLLFLFIINCNGDICTILGSLSANISTNCLNQLNMLCEQPKLLWQMFDASSKYPISGMSYGSNTDLGNFDECFAINYEDMDGKIIGKYCTVAVVVINPLIPTDLESLSFKRNYYDHRILGYNNALRASNIIDLITNGSKTMLSLCIPDQCTAEEVGDYFIWGRPENLLVAFTNTDQCITSETYTEFEAGDIAVIVFLAVILLLIIVCTSYDLLLYYTKRETKYPIFLAFSFLTNSRKLLHIGNYNREQIGCLNGLRFISMMWIIAGHNYGIYEMVPLTNAVESEDYRDHWYNQFILSAPIAVDTFFFLSGMLLAYGYLKVNTETGVLQQMKKIPTMIVHRYLRLTPALIALYLVIITIFRKLGTGAYWVTMVELFRNQCLDHWWSFLLYIQNYVNYNEICLNHTWYLSADMQMFILSPLVLIPIALFSKKHLKNVLIALGLLAVIFTIFPMAIRFADQTIDNVYDTHSRLIDYLIGIIMGLILRRTKDKPFPFTKMVNFIIWTVVLLICVAFNIYYNDVVAHYEHTKDTLFYGLYRPIWSLSLSWMVYSCHNGYGGIINWILTRRFFQIGGRLSYCMYLLHAVIIAHYAGRIRTLLHFSDWDVFYIWCGHFLVTMFLSFLWSLSFELPMITVENFIFGGYRRPVKKEQQQ